MQNSNRQNPNTNLNNPSQSEFDDLIELNRLKKQMKINLIFFIIHVLITVLLFNLQKSHSTFFTNDPVPNSAKQTYQQSYSPSEIRYRPFSESERRRYRDIAKQMFYHGYDNYMRYAFPLDELNPVTCSGRGPDTQNPYACKLSVHGRSVQIWDGKSIQMNSRDCYLSAVYSNITVDVLFCHFEVEIEKNNININDVLGNYSLTLLDSLDMLAILGNTSEFKKAINRVVNTVSFSQNVTVQVFEASIRVLGALLSSHLLIEDEEKDFGDLRPLWYSDQLLYLSEELATKLLPAFDDSFSGLPHPRVNLNGSKPVYRVNTTCAAGAGTLLIEFGILSRLLGNSTYERLARKAMEIIFNLKSQETGLVGNTIDIQSGLWTDQMTGLGAGIDSLYEYIFKSYILFGKRKDLDAFTELYANVMRYLKRGRPCEVWKADVEWTPFFANVDMHSGEIINTWIDALSASFPALQVLSGDLNEAICSHAFYYTLWRKYEMLPERFNWKTASPTVLFSPLRPELAESTYMLYQATRNPFYLHVGKDIIDSIEKYAKTRCGYATIHNVLDKSIEDRMESFFLSETTKYLYLLFDQDNVLNKKSERFIFSTEGHIFKVTQQIRKREFHSNYFEDIKGHETHFYNIKNASNGLRFEDQCSHLPMKEFQLPITRKELGQIEAFIKFSPQKP